MWFVNPYFLAGLAGVAIPVLIHVLTRDRVRKVAFSTLRFFAGASNRILRRRRFQEMVLLAMRMLVCALLAIAFARPFLNKQNPQATGMTKAGTARVILADVSASMSRRGAAEGLKKQASAALAGLVDGADAAALVVFADFPEVQVRLTKNLPEVEEKLRAVSAGQGGTDLPAAIKAADAILRQVDAPSKEILLISDFQKVSWRSFKGDWKLPPGVKLLPKVVTPTEPAANVALAMASCPDSIVLDRMPRTLAARIANYSSGELPNVEVKLAIRGKTVDRQKVNLRPGGTADVRFRHVFDAVGDNPGCIIVGVDDTDRGDNVYYFNTRVTQQIRVLILNGKPDANPLMDGAFHLKLALTASEHSPFLAESIPASAASAANINDAMVVVLANVNTVSAEVKSALVDLLGRGGGVFFLPGQRVSAQTFNSTFADILPCKLRRIVSPTAAAGKAAEAALAKIDYNHPIFQQFYRPRHGDLSMAKFARYWEVSYLDLPDPQQIRVPARFDDGDRPAIVERRIGQGLSMMLTSAIDPEWNNLPLRAIFLPYVHETVRYLAVRSERPTELRIGQALNVPPDRKIKGPKGQMLGPDERMAREAGFYTQVSPEGAEEFVFAANRPMSEADPTPVAPEKIQAAIETADDGAPRPTDAGTFLGKDKDKDERNIWWYVMLAVTGLLVAELIVGNRTMRH